MPRNASGVYSLPEVPFVPNTVIESAPVNSNFDDIGDTLTLSLATTGVSEMTGPFKAANGTVTAPSITFGNALGTGFFLADTDTIGLAIAGVTAAFMGTDRVLNLLVGVAVGNASVADNEVLDWYEEETFVPSLQFGGASTGITYTTRTGKYTRIGNLVFFNIIITVLDNGSATGAATVTGLPYDALEATVVPMTADALDNFVSGIPVLGIIEASSATIDLTLLFDGDQEAIDETMIVNGSSFILSGYYIVE